MRKVALIVLLFVICCFAKNQRIIGGSVTSTAKYPYQVAIVQESGGGYAQFCGGSILSKNYVLTAAHCFRDISGSSNKDKSLSNIFAASTSQISSISTNKLYSVTTANVHPSFSVSNSAANQVDICVLRVSTITFDSNTLPVVLARQQDQTLFPPGTTSFVTGFGLTDGTKNSGASSSNDLMEVSIPIVTSTACQQALSNSGLTVNFPVVCAGADGKDSCQGDSGGPLTIASQGTYVQVGVVIFGTVSSNNAVQCGAAGNYGVYTSVADYRATFIEPITGSLPVLGDSGVAFTNGTGGGSNSSNSFHSLSPLFLFCSFLFVLILNFF